MILSDEQVKRYHEDGYLAVPGVFSAEEVTELQEVIDGFVEQSRSVSDHTDVFDLEPGHSYEAPRLRRLKVPHRQHPVYDRALRNQRLLGLLRQLLGDDIRHLNTKLNSPRLEPVPVRVPLPTHERQGSIYEVQSGRSRTAFG